MLKKIIEYIKNAQAGEFNLIAVAPAVLAYIAVHQSLFDCLPHVFFYAHGTLLIVAIAFFTMQYRMRRVILPILFCYDYRRSTEGRELFFMKFDRVSIAKDDRYAITYRCRTRGIADIVIRVQPGTLRPQDWHHDVSTWMMQNNDFKSVSIIASSEALVIHGYLEGYLKELEENTNSQIGDAHVQ